MNVTTQVLIGIISLEHLYFLWVEMFGWETAGKKLFKQILPEKLFTPTKILAANQGLYNGFLSAGLLWTFFIVDVNWKAYISVFFLVCVIVAGIYGAFTASRKLFFVQALHVIITIILVLLT